MSIVNLLQIGFLQTGCTKAKNGVVRKPMQLSLDVRTIKTLNTMGINKSELFEELLPATVN